MSLTKILSEEYIKGFKIDDKIKSFLDEKGYPFEELTYGGEGSTAIALQRKNKIIRIQRNVKKGGGEHNKYKKLEGEDLENVAHIYLARVIDKTLVVVMEKVETLNMQNTSNQVLELLEAFGYVLSDEFKGYKSFDAMVNTFLVDYFPEEIDEIAPFRITDYSFDKMSVVISKHEDKLKDLYNGFKQLKDFGITHYDIWGDNLGYDKNGNIKLIDIA